METITHGEAVATRPRATSQRGEGRFKAIFWTLIIITVLYVGFKLIPPYITLYQIQDKMNEEARFAVVNHHSDEEIRNIIFREIQELDLPVKREGIKLDNTNRILRISVEYTVPIDFLVYHTDLHFNPTGEAKPIV